MRSLLFAFAIAMTTLDIAGAATVPACRLDNSLKPVVSDTLMRSAGAYREIGKALPFDTVAINATGPVPERTLSVFIVKDASAGDTTPEGCAKDPARKSAPLDPLSVLGGCVVVAADVMEMRCSSGAVRLFANIGQNPGRANPSLLYLMSHELGHLYQRHPGQYAGRTDIIDLTRDRTSKLKELQDACDPVSTKREAEADAMALSVMSRLLSEPPYREPVFSEQGSLYWNIDQLALVSDAWQQNSLEREFISRPPVHKAFEPNEFPTPAKKIDASAKRFVCDVLAKSKGTVSYPGKSVSHPPLEQRLRRIAEALQPVAKSLPDTGGQRDFEPIARLQGQLSPIFTHIYRETGVYMEAVQSSICTVVNAPDEVYCQ